MQPGHRSHRSRCLEAKILRGVLSPGVVVLLACLVAACSGTSSTSHTPTPALPTPTSPFGFPPYATPTTAPGFPVATYPAATPVPVAGHWSLVASPAVGQEGALVAVAALSASDAWAVGQYEGTDAVQHPLAEHWDGAQWTAAPTPSPGTAYNILQAVSADASNDVWAVGKQTSSAATTQALIERWNGSAWVAVPPAATVSGSSSELHGVAAISPSDVWAVGNTMHTGSNGSLVSNALVEHWDGARWSIVTDASPPSSSSGSYSSLDAVAAVSSVDVWAVGGRFIEHWDGHTWTAVPDAGGGTGFALTSISASAANDVWAIGQGLPSDTGGCGGAEGALVEHWDGAHWTSVSAAVPAVGDGLIGVAAASSSDVWIVGGSNGPTGRFGEWAPFIEHWDGAHWNTVTAPAAKTAQGLAGVAARSGVAFAVGQNVDRNGPSSTHIERWSGGQWAIVASPSPGTLANTLHAVVGLSTQDVWAVGSSSSGTLAEHWNGTAWNVVPGANSAPGGDVLYGVSAASSSDAWAVGDGMVPGSGQAGLIEHWNGTQWALASGAQSTGLRAVAAVSARDVWAVGGSLPGRGCGTREPPALIEHWDGASWSAVPNTPYGTLYGVVAIGASDVWAVGASSYVSGSNGQLIMHYDGRGWSIVPVRSLPASQRVTLYAVAGRASNDLWAVGRAYGANGLATTSFILEHWDGATWGEISTSASPGPVTSELDGVTALSRGDAWAVGSFSASFDTSQALLLHYMG